MSKKSDQQSDYEQCNTLLLSAYFCVMGQSLFDNQLRRSIEDILTELFKARNETTAANVIPFCRKHREVS